MNDTLAMKAIDSLYESTSSSHMTGNITDSSMDNSRYPLDAIGRAMGLVVQSLLCLVCITGNFLVIRTVILIKSLRDDVSNILIASLAGIDMLVGVGVMPFGILYQVTGYWTIGRGACIGWVTLDVILCTASINNLTMIAVEKYINITKPLFPVSKRKMVTIYCLVIWATSITIGVVPLIVSWYPVFDEGKCHINLHLGYQLYATFIAFYLPLIIMLVVYGKILKISLSIAKDTAKQRPRVLPLEEVDSLVDDIEVQQPSNHKHSTALDNNLNVTSSAHRSSNSTTDTNFQPLCSEARGVHSNKKSIQTLGIIMGVFLVCWLPFFIYALVRTFCKEKCTIPQVATDILTWLGYLNSCINPLIYAHFYKKFGIPMKEMLCCRWKNVRASVRQQIYEEKFGN
ncbi:5-hydroxytryptamine receptor 1A-alpha-like [Watersipora subatra]|uniref:5-hydroxytryptamine receptor 1A-alpha-like n=1 Tax=Watersipora subatra TaxID=2589382 RepID=UPI00355C5D45